MSLFGSNGNLTDQERLWAAMDRVERAEREYALAESELIKARRVLNSFERDSAWRNYANPK